MVISAEVDVVALSPLRSGLRAPAYIIGAAVAGQSAVQHLGPAMPRKQPLLLLAVAAVAAGGSAAVASAAAVAVSGAAAPSAVQLKMLRAGGLSQFMHFSVDPFTSIEHNCVGTSGKCVPASAFAPTDLDTDQW